MDEFFNEMDQSGTDGNEPEIKSGETAFEGFEPVQQPQEDYTQSTEPFYGTAEADSPYNPTQPFTTVYNPVNFSPVEPIENYKPMSRGLKVFAFLLRFLILPAS